MSETLETNAKAAENKANFPHGFTTIYSGCHVDADFARTLETQRDEARAEVRLLRKAIADVLPGMKCQQPPKLGAWNWPWAVETLETALQPDLTGWRPAGAPEKLSRLNE